MSREKQNISKIFLDQYQNKDKENDFLQIKINNEKKIMKEIELKTENIIKNAYTTGQITNPFLEKDN